MMRKLVYYFISIILIYSLLGCANTIKGVREGIGTDAENNWETTKVWSYDLHKLCCNVAKNTKKAVITTTKKAENIKYRIKDSWATMKKWDANFRKNWW